MVFLHFLINQKEDSMHVFRVIFMFFSYRGGVDIEGRPVMVVVGAHFLLRCLDLERFVLYVVKVIQLYPSAWHIFLLTSTSSAIINFILNVGNAYFSWNLFMTISFNPYPFGLRCSLFEYTQNRLGVKFQEFEPIMQKPYTIVYFHSASSLQM